MCRDISYKISNIFQGFFRVEKITALWLNTGISNFALKPYIAYISGGQLYPDIVI